MSDREICSLFFRAGAEDAIGWLLAGEILQVTHCDTSRKNGTANIAGSAILNLETKKAHCHRIICDIIV